MLLGPNSRQQITVSYDDFAVFISYKYLGHMVCSNLQDNSDVKYHVI